MRLNMKRDKISHQKLNKGRKFSNELKLKIVEMIASAASNQAISYIEMKTQTTPVGPSEIAVLKTLANF